MRLGKEIFGSMLDVIIGKGGHEVVAMIVLGLVADVHSFHTGLFCCFGEVFGKQLTLFVEIVPSPLECETRQSICLQPPKAELSLDDELIGHIPRQSTCPRVLSTS
jgi:hypothetical protein